MIHDLSTQKGRNHYSDAMSGKKKESQFLEIRTDYMDDKGVIHIDGYKTLDDNEEGVGIGYFIHGKVYWRNPEYQFDPLVKDIVEDMKKEQKPFILDSIDYNKLKAQKLRLVNLSEDDTVTNADYDALQGIIALVDSIQDYAVDVMGKSEAEVFQLEDEVFQLKDEDFNPKIGDFFKMLEDYDGFKEGTILLLGNIDTMEYFDITTEMTKGDSYSAYNLPPSILEKFEPKEQSELSKVFEQFILNDYKIDKNILKY
jgi:hypothetical protein